jgi:hypothetical protein
MVIKALNNIARLDSLILILLVFKAYFRINNDLLFLLNIIKKAEAI